MAGFRFRKLVDQRAPFTESGIHPKTTLISTLKALPDHLNPTFLSQKYSVEKLSMRQIAALTGASRTAILDSLKRSKIPVRERGKALDRQASLPFGKRRVNGKIVVYQTEARVIESIKKMRLEEGMSYLAIARILTEMKVPTKLQGKAWHHEMIRQILMHKGLINKNGREIQK